MFSLHLTPLRPLLKRYALLAGSFAALCALQACSSAPPANRFNYDFGPFNAASNSLPKTDKPVQFAINVADIDAPAIFEGSTMFYRLGYDNPQQLRPYAQQHWSMSPALLLGSRIKTQIAAAGGTVLAVSDGVANLPTLKIDLEEFSQYFADASNNQVQLRFRASLVRNGKLLGQRHFNGSKASSSADAAGGAKAMQVLTDEAIADLVRWMQALDFK